MGKKERLKRSPSLSLKELKEFISTTSCAADEEVDITNQEKLRRSSRHRGPPKDPYAKDFVGDIWKQMHGSNIHSPHEPKVITTTRASENVDDDEYSTADDAPGPSPSSKRGINGADELHERDQVVLPDFHNAGTDTHVADSDTLEGPLNASPFQTPSVALPKNREISWVNSIKDRYSRVPEDRLYGDSVSIGLDSTLKVASPTLNTPKFSATSGPIDPDLTKSDDLDAGQGFIISNPNQSIMVALNDEGIFELSKEKMAISACLRQTHEIDVEPNALNIKVDIGGAGLEKSVQVEDDKGLLDPLDVQFVNSNVLASESVDHAHLSPSAPLDSRPATLNSSSYNGQIKHVPPLDNPEFPVKVLLPHMGSSDNDEKVPPPIEAVNAKDTCQSYFPSTNFILSHTLPKERSQIQVDAHKAAYPGDGLPALNDSCDFQLVEPTKNIKNIGAVMQTLGASGDPNSLSAIIDFGKDHITGVGPLANVSLTHDGVHLVNYMNPTDGVQAKVSNGPTLAYQVPASPCNDSINKNKWADLLKPTSHDFSLSHIDVSSCRQERRLVVPPAVIDSGCHEWNNTLVGFFLGRKLPYSLVHKATSKFWENAGLIDILATDHGTYFFKFSSSFTLDAMLEGGPWNIAGQPLILQKWEPHFSINKDKVSKVPIWVHFYNIPLEYWTPGGISYIASMIGKPLRVDKMTASRRRITYARVCIEVDAKDEWITSFDLVAADPLLCNAPVLIKVEYQWTPSRCNVCKCFGHDCERKVQSQPTYSNPANQKSTHQWIPIKKVPNDMKDVAGNTVENEKDQWTQVVGKSKGKGVVAKEGQLDATKVVVPHAPSSSYAQEIKISNSFNKLVPYVYEIDGYPEEDHRSGLSAEDGNFQIQEREYDNDNLDMNDAEIDENIDDVYDESLLIPEQSTSSRQKKKEAKMRFSGNRPKGRHRS